MLSRHEEIIGAILQALANMGEELCSEPVLFAALKLMVTGPLLLSEFVSALKHCEAQRWVLGLRPKLGATKWGLTDQGRAVLAEA